MSTIIYPACPESGLCLETALWKPDCAFERNHLLFVKRLQSVDDILADLFPGESQLQITSGWRSEAYNTKIGGHHRSNHLIGTAADVACSSSRYRAILIELCLEHALSVGIYKTHLHVDLRSRAVVWVA